MAKIETINYQGKDYATVPARLKEFREKHPRAAITTDPQFMDDGSLIFKAKIQVDRSDPDSAIATGHARYTANEVSKPKAFEKLETVSIGRCLSILGYLNNGQVATSEEMEEFENYQSEKLEGAKEKVAEATKRGDFESILSELNAEQQKEIAPIIKARMMELKNAS